MIKQFTNYKQSLRLLNAGIPKSTSDYFFLEGSDEYIDKRWAGGPKFNYIPCWSMAALWELMHRASPVKVKEFSTSLSSAELIEQMVETIVLNK